MSRLAIDQVVAVLSMLPSALRLEARMPPAASVAAGLASKRSMPDVSMSMVWTLTALPERLKDETTLRVALKPAALESIDSQFWPENDAESAMPFSCFCNWAIS